MIPDDIQQTMDAIRRSQDQGYAPATPLPHEAPLVETVMIAALQSVDKDGKVAPFRLPPFVALRIVRALYGKLHPVEQSIQGFK